LGGRKRFAQREQVGSWGRNAKGSKEPAKGSVHRHMQGRVRRLKCENGPKRLGDGGEGKEKLRRHIAGGDLYEKSTDYKATAYKSPKKQDAAFRGSSAERVGNRDRNS